MNRLLAVILFALPACGLTEIGTTLEVSGDPRSMRYLATGEGEVGDGVTIYYRTSADKTVTFQIDKDETATFLDFTSGSDSTIAGAARARDRDSIDATNARWAGVVSAIVAAQKPGVTP